MGGRVGASGSGDLKLDTLLLPPVEDMKVGGGDAEGLENLLVAARGEDVGDARTIEEGVDGLVVETEGMGQ